MCFIKLGHKRYAITEAENFLSLAALEVAILVPVMKVSSKWHFHFIDKLNWFKSSIEKI